MGRILQFNDRLDLEPMTSVATLKDQIMSAKKSGADEQIYVRIAATHAGRKTRNHGLYLPDRMRQSESSWTKHYAKPVDKHHNNHSDPIGRVTAARYVDTTPLLKDSWLSSLDSDFKRLVDGRLTLKDAVSYVADKLSTTGILDDPDYEGAGYMELIARISDPDAVQKILDGRLLTCSTVQTTNHAFCSVCKEDWSSGRDNCDHTPGKAYKGKTCMLIAGDLEGRAISYVNEPADSLSQTIEILEDGKITDSITVEHLENNSTIQERPYEILMADSFQKDAVGIKSMADKQMVINAHDTLHHRYDYRIKSREGDVAISKEDADLHVKLHQEAKAGDFLSAFMPGELDALLEDKSLYPQVVTVKGLGESQHMDKDTNTDLTLEDMAKSIGDQEVADKALFEDLFTKLKAEEAGAEDLTDFLKDYALSQEQMAAILSQIAQVEAAEAMWGFIMDAEWENYNKVEDEEFSKAWDEEVEKAYAEEIEAADSDEAKKTLEDAKLSSGQRKKLASGTFCGPGRSFPVPDCSHVTAARRMIGKAKASTSTKARILTCVSRKARALGCGTKRDSTEVPAAADAGSTSDLSFEQVATWLGEQKDVRGIADKLLETRALEICGTDCTAIAKNAVELEGKVKELEAKLAEDSCTECKENQKLADSLKAEKVELEAQVKVLRDEYKLALADQAELTDALVDAEDLCRNAVVERVMDLELLKNGKLEDELSREDRKALLLKDSAESLVEKSKALLEVVDITKISDKLINSGLANQPDGTVADPTKQVDQHGKVIIDGKMTKRIEAEAMTLQIGGTVGKYHGAQAVTQYLRDQVASGNIPAALIEKLKKESASGA